MILGPIPNPYLFKGGSLSDYEVLVGKAGTWATRHISSGDTIQSTVPKIGGTMDPLSLASLGVGLLNLGVGVYNAVQIKKTQAQVRELHADVLAGFGEVERLLYAQARTLSRLLRGQKEILKSIQQLERRVSDGFKGVHTRLADQEAQEFETRCRALTLVWQRFTDTVDKDEHPGAEAERLIEAADAVHAWADVRLGRMPVGSPARQPYLIAIAMALRAIADATAVRGGAAAANAIHRLELFATQLSKEAFDYCATRPLYLVATDMTHTLPQYAFLRRGILRGISVTRELATGPLRGDALRAEDAMWVGGLPDLRIALEVSSGAKTVGGAKRIPLKTMDDYEWYLKFSGKERTDFDVHSKRAIGLGEILAPLGASGSTRVPVNQVDRIKRLVLPAARDAVVVSLGQEFEWGSLPEFGRLEPRRRLKARASKTAPRRRAKSATRRRARR